MNASDMQGFLACPPESGKGYTRWWWYGCCVEKGEIDRELDYMKEAGIGGVELQILYPVVPDDADAGFYNIPFGSPEFYEVLAYTGAACARRGMALDITPGSSWPFGGPFIEDEDAQQQALPYQLDVHGPCAFSCDFTTRFAGTICAAVMGKMEKCVMLPESVRDITEKFQEKMLFGWPWGTELDTIEIPDGDWKLCFFVISQHRNRVGKPGRDAGGRVIDHGSRRAMTVFLRNMVLPIAERVPSIHAYFCDSIEVEGHNWTRQLLEEFKARRGYDLGKYIYALWGDMGEITPHVRYDYFKTMSEMTIEHFFDVLTEFAHAHGALSRIQAHGTWGDILRAYASADIPEGETFGDHRTLEVNTIHRRLAVSAGHVYGKNIISNETFTWLKRPRFTETLEEMKAAVDAVFCDGANMIVNHGYAYAPEKAGKRGWPFYASTHINHTTPWWPYYRHLARYIQGVSALLRRGEPHVEVAVYLPQADVYAENMLSELHLAMRIEEKMGRRAMDAIQKAGYWFDYINDEALVREAPVAYRAILLVESARLPVETARALRDYARRGGVLIAQGQVPHESCGLMKRAENARRVREMMADAFAQKGARVVENREGALIDALQDAFAPDVRIVPSENVGYVHRVEGQDHLYFLSNISDVACEAQATFRDRDEPARVFDPVSGALKWFTRCGRTLRVPMAAHESVVVCFSGGLQAAEMPQAPAGVGTSVALSGWTLTALEAGLSFKMEEPVSWETLPGLAHFSGIGVYQVDFTLNEAPAQAYLTLENLSCAASVRINGADAGDIWTHPLRCCLSGHLRAGVNHLSISVSSTLVNEMLAADEYEPLDTVLPAWPYYGKVIDNERSARLNGRRERAEMAGPIPSGIWGRVLLKVPDCGA
ncbi:MAG: glycosyl hydrolase [Clostridia bacterium]